MYAMDIETYWTTFTIPIGKSVLPVSLCKRIVVCEAVYGIVRLCSNWNTELKETTENKEGS